LALLKKKPRRKCLSNKHPLSSVRTIHKAVFREVMPEGSTIKCPGKSKAGRSY
jgi:hypothetical protein